MPLGEALPAPETVGLTVKLCLLSLFFLGVFL